MSHRLKRSRALCENWDEGVQPDRHNCGGRLVGAQGRVFGAASDQFLSPSRRSRLSLAASVTARTSASDTLLIQSAQSLNRMLWIALPPARVCQGRVHSPGAKLAGPPTASVPSSRVVGL